MTSVPDTCERQASCSSWTFEPQCTSPKCGWKACLTLFTELNLNRPGTCLAGRPADEVLGVYTHPQDQCGPSQASFQVLSALPDGLELCQTGEPGSTLSFYVYDGACGVGSITLPPQNAATVSCAPGSGGNHAGCDGDGLECVWTVILPATDPCVVAESMPALRLSTTVSESQMLAPAGYMLIIGMFLLGFLAWTVWTAGVWYRRRRLLNHLPQQPFGMDDVDTQPSQ